MLGKEAARAWIDPFPLIQRFGPAQLVALTVLAAGGWAIHRALNRPRVADLLIETEGELRKVTWPSSHETISGTVAVAVTVVVMFVFLIVADLLLTYVLHKAMGVV
ncbi:MAG: preprotein translocase subunit SecE [Planctomycetes bacterium]|nr:preprotein translocase subunit SecE [Planctomycetota bacterium]